jgi:hypothetical protein
MTDSKQKTVEELANSVMKETNHDQLKEMLKDEVNVKVFEIAGIMGSQKGSTGPLEFTVEFGRKCFDLGSEEMRKKMEQSYKELKDWAESKGLDVTTYGK